MEQEYLQEMADYYADYIDSWFEFGYSQQK